MKLSVVTVTYNHERFIAQAIESILAQNVNFDYEIVIGEDCSTDGTRAVVEEFHRRYPDRIRLLLRERNVGSQRNFIETVEACRGEYVAFLDGDDYWTATDKLQKQVDFLDTHPDRAICCGRARAVYDSRPEDFDGWWDVVPVYPTGTYTFESVLKTCFVYLTASVLRREFIPSFPQWLYEMKLADWPLCIMVARHGKFELTDDVVAAYRIHTGGIWSALPHLTRLNELARMLKALDKEFGYQYSDVIREAIARPYLDQARWSRANGERLEAAKYVLHYARNGGWRCRGGARAIAGILTYGVVGSWYKLFSRTRAADQN
jgi:glycosyltransferase involved in cell wall biosynthesis